MFSKLRFAWKFLLFNLNVIQVRSDAMQQVAHQALISTYSVTWGLSNYVFSTLISLREKFYKYNFHTSFEHCPELVLKLRQRGYVRINKFIEPNLVNEIIQHLKSIPSHPRKNDTISSDSSERHNPIRVDYYQEDLLSNKTIRNIISDERLLQIAQAYFNARPVLSNSWAWVLFPSKAASSEAAQLFHFDMENLKFLKFFIYLSDVTKKNGPHCFVPKTHKLFSIPYKLFRRGYVRIGDEEVVNIFGEYETFTGYAGDLIIEDTSGLHKGSRVLEGSRLIFEFQYSNSRYGQNILQHKIQIDSDESSNKYAYTYSDFYHLHEVK